jgi:outer membrane protein
MKKTFFFIMILLSGYLQWSNAQNVLENLTLQRALDLLDSTSLTLQQQQLRIEQASRQLDIEKAGYFPSVLLNGNYNYTSEVAKFVTPFAPIEIRAGYNNVYDANIMLQQPLFTGFRTTNRVRSAEQSLQQARISRQTVINQISLQIYNLYYAIQLNQLQQQVIKTGIIRASNDLNSIRNFFRAGQTSAFDTLKMANGLLSLKTQLNKLSHNKKVLLTQLAYVLNVPGINSTESFSPSDLVITMDSLSIYQSLALNHRPELSEIKHHLQAQRFQKKSLQSLYFPQIFAQASYHYARPGVNFFQDKWMKYYRIGVNFQWELWNRNRVGNQVKLAGYTVSILKKEQEKLLEQVNQQVREAWENLQSDKDQIAFLRELVAQEKERYRITRDKYDQGLATTLDLSDAENALTSAELQLQQSYIKWMQDSAYLSYATGRIRPSAATNEND